MRILNSKQPSILPSCHDLAPPFKRNEVPSSDSLKLIADHALKNWRLFLSNRFTSLTWQPSTMTVQLLLTPASLSVRAVPATPAPCTTASRPWWAGSTPTATSLRWRPLTEPPGRRSPPPCCQKASRVWWALWCFFRSLIVRRLADCQCVLVLIG